MPQGLHPLAGREYAQAAPRVSQGPGGSFLALRTQENLRRFARRLPLEQQTRRAEYLLPHRLLLWKQLALASRQVGPSGAYLNVRPSRPLWKACRLLSAAA